NSSPRYPDLAAGPVPQQLVKEPTKAWQRIRVRTQRTSASMICAAPSAWSRPLYLRGRSLLGQPGGRDVGHLEVEPQTPHLLAVGHEQGHDDAGAEVGTLLHQP